MLAAVVMIGLLFHLGAKWLIGVNGSDPEYIAAISLLEKLRSANEHSSKAVDVAKNATRPKFVLCRLLKSIAQSTPQTLVLSSIGIASSTTKTEFEFSLQGYGLNSSSSLSFIDSLRGEAGVLEINLTKGTTVENRFASLGANFKSKSLIKFEVIGKYAVN